MLLTLSFLLLWVHLELMRTSLATMEVSSPLDHNLEAVLPGVHTRLGSMQTEMATGFEQLKECLESHIEQSDRREEQFALRERASQAVAAQMVTFASAIVAGGSAGQLPLPNSQLPLPNSQRQAAADDDDDDDDNDDCGSTVSRLVNASTLASRSQ
jgi:hypothetical protein